MGEADADGGGGGEAGGGIVCGVGVVRSLVTPSLVQGGAQLPRPLALGRRSVKAVQFAAVLGLNSDISKARSLQDMFDLSNKGV